MRTIPFRNVFNRVIRMHGRDPKGEVSADETFAITERINDRVRFICQVWRWPEWELTEERAFRQVWNATHQYLRASAIDGKPDEVFYIPNTTYYRVALGASDPPVGGTPDIYTSFWERIDPVDTFIAYDQICKRAIGMVLGVYSKNPRVPTGSANGLLRYMPSERGIDVLGPAGPTVFVTYEMPVPEYTMLPYVTGKNYEKGDIVFDPTVNECFQASAPTTAIPADATFWRRVPFPRSWATYVAKGAFGDSLMEYDQGDQSDAQVKKDLAQDARNEAEKSLEMEIDALTVQGQKLQWNFCRRPGHWCESQPWSGGTVITLTDICDDELGWIYPAPTTVPGVVWQYHNEINALRTSESTPALDALPTRMLLEGSLVEIVIPVGGVLTRMTFQLVNGPADLNDPNGQVQPLDYDAVNNNKHWSRVT